MKKFPLVFFASLFFLFLISGTAQGICNDGAGGIVPCGNTPACPCTIEHIFVIFGAIYDFIVKFIAAPLAVIGLTVGGIMILISGGSPELVKKGKNAVILSSIGLVLVFGSYLIINFILDTLGYKYK